jgi:hypothetical protein
VALAANAAGDGSDVMARSISAAEVPARAVAAVDDVSVRIQLSRADARHRMAPKLKPIG